MRFSPSKHPWPVKNAHKKLLPTHLITSQGQWFYLFHALILFLIVYPLFEMKDPTSTPFSLALVNSALLMTIVFTASYNLRQFLFAFTLSLPALIFFWFHAFWAASYIILISTGLLYLYAIVLLVPYLIHSNKVTSEEIFGATSLYLLLGFLWATLFQVLEMVAPGSFYIAYEQNIDGVLNWSDFIFYSFTTLTTLGYGDITPITSHARSLSIIEAITGVIFIAAMLSRAIGIYTAQTIEMREEENE